MQLKKIQDKIIFSVWPRSSRLLVLLLLLMSWRAEAALTYSPKIYLRTSGSFLDNTALTSSGIGFGSFTIHGHLFLNQYLSAGIGYDADFDLTNFTIPFKGYDIQGRVYFLGEGTQVLDQNSVITRSGRSMYSMYLLGEYAIRDYLLYVTPALSFTGTVNMFNMGVGMDMAFWEHFDLNAELAGTLLTFSSQPDQVKLYIVRFLGGVGYVF